MYINTSLAQCAGEKRGYTEMRVEQDYTFKFDLEQVWYIYQACAREKRTAEINTEIAERGFADESFINECKYDCEQYAKILNQLTEAVKEESED